MDVLIHIGLPKTGTTTLQKTFRKSDKYLLSKRILYPKGDATYNSYSHAPLAGLFFGQNSLKRKLADYYADESSYHSKVNRYLNLILSEITQAKPSCVVLSAEQLANPIQNLAVGQCLRELFGQSIRFIMYVRRPSERYLSNIAEHVKTSHKILPYRFHANRTLLSYENVFGLSSIGVRLFDRRSLRSGDLVADFVHHYLNGHNIEFSDLIRSNDSNNSLSAESALIMQSFRYCFFNGRNHVHFPESLGLLKLLKKGDRLLGSDKIRFREGIADRIDYCNDEPLLLRNRYGVEFIDFDYNRLELQRFSPPLGSNLTLHDLIVIDRLKLRELLEFLENDDWLSSSNQRRRWLRNLLISN